MARKWPREATRAFARLGIAPAMVFALLTSAVTSAKAPAVTAAKPIELVRLDCGVGSLPRAFLSDTFAYDAAGTFDGVASCYLIRHGDSYLLWDAGLSHAFAEGKPASQPHGPTRFVLRRTIVDQLAQLKIKPDQIQFVALSHAHFDHVGQASDFPKARLLIGEPDLAAIRRTPLPQGIEPASLQPWRAAGSNAQGVTGDYDVFGDGSVVMLATPGHTAGHHSLLVRLPETGPVLLTGDLFHAESQVTDGNVSMHVENRADALASAARIKAIIANLHARLIVSHEASDITKLPAFPTAAR